MTSTYAIDEVDEDHERYQAEQIMDALDAIDRAARHEIPHVELEQLGQDREALLEQLAALGYER